MFIRLCALWLHFWHGFYAFDFRCMWIQSANGFLCTMEMFDCQKKSNFFIVHATYCFRLQLHSLRTQNMSQIISIIELILKWSNQWNYPDYKCNFYEKNLENNNDNCFEFLEFLIQSIERVLTFFLSVIQPEKCVGSKRQCDTF